VETNRSIKWCPLPGCGRAVRLPPDQMESSQPSLGPANTSHAVDCGNGHFFCWECLGEAHAPCGLVFNTDDGTFKLPFSINIVLKITQYSSLYTVSHIYYFKLYNTHKYH
jgi:hypothetical protein